MLDAQGFRTGAQVPTTVRVAGEGVRFPESESIATLEQIAELRRLWEQNLARITAIQQSIRDNSYMMVLPDSIAHEITRSIRNPFILVWNLNEVLRVLLEKMMAFMDDPVNVSRLSSGSASKLLQAGQENEKIKPGIASFTPDIFAPDFFARQDDHNYARSIQNNMWLCDQVLHACMRHFPGNGNDLDTEIIDSIVSVARGPDDLVQLPLTVERYVEAYRQLTGRDDMTGLLDMTDAVATYMEILTVFGNTVMYPVARDLLANIVSLQAGILMMVGKAIEDDRCGGSAKNMHRSYRWHGTNVEC